MSKPTAVVGIDPGKAGYLCLLPFDGTPMFRPVPVVAVKAGKNVYDEADLVRVLREWLGEFDVLLAAVERQQARPGQGVTSMFSQGEGFGLIKGVLVALSVPLVTPTPQAWQKVMHAGVFGPDPKARSLVACGRLYPRVSLLETERCRVQNNNMADALLIAGWAARQVGSGTWQTSP